MERHVFSDINQQTAAKARCCWLSIFVCVQDQPSTVSEAFAEQRPRGPSHHHFRSYSRKRNYRLERSSKSNR